MKYKVVVEYEYPVEHKTPVKAELILHGDRVETWNVKPLEQEPILDKIRAEIIELRSKQNVGVLECLDVIDKYKAESEPQEDKEQEE